MNIAEEIKDAYAGAKNYPDLAQRLINAGVQSYTVDVATGIILYRLENGAIHLSTPNSTPKGIVGDFSNDNVILAIRDNQQGKTDYPAFMNAIATAGTRFYEATLNGNNKRVTYIGSGGFYEESIPIGSF